MKICVTKINGQLATYHVEKPITGYELIKKMAQPGTNFLAFIENGEIKDLSTEISSESAIKLITATDPSAWSVINYSCALLLAQGLKTLYPTAIITLAHPNDDGFYLDFDYKTRLTVADLKVIEQQMNKLLNQNFTIKRVCQSLTEALKTYHDNVFITEYLQLNNNSNQCSYLLADSNYVLADYVATNSTQLLQHFKLLNITGAYWQGNKNNKQLQRITGICDISKEALTNVIAKIAERKARDHRTLGKELNIFTFNDDCGKGLPIFLPNGMIIKKALQEYLRAEEFKWEYQEVATPVLGSVSLYKKSGHWDHYRENMFTPIVKDDEQLVLRPMTCPHHCMIYTSVPRSYRELPLRLSEHALLYRYEASGGLTGLERVRSMELTDSHIFVRSDQIKSEFKRCYQLIASVLETLNIKIDYLSLSLRDNNDKEKYFNDDNMWEKAQTALKEVLDELHLEYKTMIGEAAFYGPKLDIQIKTVVGHEITVSTIQFDFLLPQRFKLTYIDKNNREQTPVIIHRGLIGTYERFIATLLEQTSGALPLWLAPQQIAILPINESPELLAYANEIYQLCRQQNFRVHIIANGTTLNKRIAETNKQKIPYQIVIGNKELTNNNVNYRQYGSAITYDTTLGELLQLLTEQIAAKK